MNRNQPNKTMPTTDNSTSTVNNSSAVYMDLHRSTGVRRAQNTLLVWLDYNLDERREDYRNSIGMLQRVVHDIETFTDVDSCIEFLRSIENSKACMIVSGSLGQRLVPQIHDILQVDSILIFCANRERHENWIKEWPKIKGVSADIELLCEIIKQIAQQVEQNAMLMSFIATDKRPDQLNPTFMYTQLFKEILLTIDFDSTHRQQYVDYCRELFATNSAESAHVTQLEQNYCKEKAIWWYTHHCFLYPMLNRALYLMDGDIITRMGFFIKDLHELIGQLYVEQFPYEARQEIFTVYRGQALSRSDFEHMQHSKGGLISFNNFLSTSRDRQTALCFAQNAIDQPDLQAVLFVININPLRSTTPFASITAVSEHTDENEILFSMHSVFRIHSIEQMSDNDHAYEVHITLTNDNDPQLYELSYYMRRESHVGEGPWHRLGALLLRMGQSSKAEEIFEGLLCQITDESEKVLIYDRLGLAKFNQGKYHETIECGTKLLAIYQQAPVSEHLGLANTWNRMGTTYLSLGDCANALKAHQDAIRILQQAVEPDHPDLAKSHNNIGLTYCSMSDFAAALSSYQKALAISQRSLPTNHPDLASLYCNIGSVHQSMGDLQKALSYYEKDFAISQQSLPPNHPDLAKSYNNLGSVYQSMGNLEKALSYYEEDLSISQQSLPPNHPDLAKTYNNLGDVYRRMNDFAKALSSHEMALAICQRTLASDHPDLAVCYDYIGNVYRGMGDLKKALSYHQQALAINEQSLPPRHPGLASSYNNIGNVYCNMGRYDRALAFHEKALSIRQQSFSTNHPEVASSYSNIGIVYEKMHDYPKARLFYERAMRSAEHSLYPERSNLQLHRNNVARVKRKC